MTREQKLALILGFALTLVVGVLISDHLSGARAAGMPELTEALTPRDQPRPGLGRDRSTYMLVEREETTLHDVAGTYQPVDERILPQPTPDRVVELNNGNRHETQFAQVFDQVRQGIGELRPVAQHETIIMGENRLNQGNRRAEVPQIDPIREDARPIPTEHVHRVEQGDTLWKIAERYYGDGSQWRRIAEAEQNKGRIMADSQVRNGASIVIPGVPAVSQNNQRGTQRPAQLAPRQQTYTVQRGDTLGEISMKTLGTSRRWREILELNRDRIRDPNVVPVGVELRLPPVSS